MASIRDFLKPEEIDKADQITAAGKMTPEIQQRLVGIAKARKVEGIEPGQFQQQPSQVPLEASVVGGAVAGGVAGQAAKTSFGPGLARGGIGKDTQAVKKASIQAVEREAAKELGKKTPRVSITKEDIGKFAFKEKITSTDPEKNLKKAIVLGGKLASKKEALLKAIDVANPKAVNEAGSRLLERLNGKLLEEGVNHDDVSKVMRSVRKNIVTKDGKVLVNSLSKLEKMKLDSKFVESKVGETISRQASRLQKTIAKDVVEEMVQELGSTKKLAEFVDLKKQSGLASIIKDASKQSAGKSGVTLSATHLASKLVKSKKARALAAKAISKAPIAGPILGGLLGFVVGKAQGQTGRELFDTIKESANPLDMFFGKLGGKIASVEAIENPDFKKFINMPENKKLPVKEAYNKFLRRK